MAVTFMTYNFSLDEQKYKTDEKMIYATLKDKRNGISTTNIIPGLQCYMNYLDLLLMLRDKWISTGYLDLGMIPIIVGPSFMHEALVSSILPIIQMNKLKVYAMPGTSFMLRDTMKSSTDYWAFRDDVAQFLGCDASKVTTRAVLEKIMGVTLE